jgi:hypothetical protein
MFGQQHVTHQLTAYAHGELTAPEAQRVAAHLDACARCRREFAEITYGMRLVGSLNARRAPANLWDNIEAELARESTQPQQTEHAVQATTREQPSRRITQEKFARHDWRLGWLSGWHVDWFSGWRSPALAASLILLVMFGAGGAWFYLRSTRPTSSWEVARLSGAPSIDADRIGATGRLGIGEWLETDADSRAQIKVADIGQVEVDPDTRIRLVETRRTEHRLELARGRMHATIYAAASLLRGHALRRRRRPRLRLHARS